MLTPFTHPPSAPQVNLVRLTPEQLAYRFAPPAGGGQGRRGASAQPRQPLGLRELVLYSIFGEKKLFDSYDSMHAWAATVPEAQRAGACAVGGRRLAAGGREFGATAFAPVAWVALPGASWAERSAAPLAAADRRLAGLEAAARAAAAHAVEARLEARDAAAAVGSASAEAREAATALANAERRLCDAKAQLRAAQAAAA